MKGVIYKIVDIRNNKCYYGSTKNYEKRVWRHKNDLINGRHHNQILQRIWSKHGDVFKYYIIDEVPVKDLLKEEQKYLDINKDGYNIGKTASGGDNLTGHPNKVDIVARITKSVKKRYEDMTLEERKSIYGKCGETNSNWCGGKKKCKCGKEISKNNLNCINCLSREGENNPFYGKKHSDETKRKIKEQMLGKKPSNCKPFVIDGVRYESLNDASELLGIKQTTIRWRIISDNLKYVTYCYC